MRVCFAADEPKRARGRSRRRGKSLTVDEYIDHFFSVATGWLGWTPEVALGTPIPQIELALEGRIEWVRKTNPWGSGDPAPAPPVSERLKAALRARAAR
ncbi:MAG: hypothetical protein L0H63_11850 [Nitrococcus sp.]|nr:hypothetical protein [Nitrococcus sp.]